MLSSVYIYFVTGAPNLKRANDCLPCCLGHEFFHVQMTYQILVYASKTTRNYFHFEIKLSKKLSISMFMKYRHNYDNFSALRNYSKKKF